MKKILASALVVAAATTALIGGTRAFFSDTEASEDNIFTAGTLDLEISSTAHYNGMVCTETSTDVYTWVAEVGYTPESNQFPVAGASCTGTWDEKNLNFGEKFFSLTDVKPGDWGENTISFRVTDNDSWLMATIDDVHNDDNGLTEPETAVDSTSGLGDGELAENLLFTAWNDNGNDGFPGTDDADGSEGNNILDDGEEIFFSDEPASNIVPGGVIWSPAFVEGGVINYVGFAWRIPADTGNIIQSDSFTFDMTFDAEQARHNDTPFSN